MVEAINVSSQNPGYGYIHTVCFDSTASKDILYGALDHFLYPTPYTNTVDTDTSLLKAPHFIKNVSNFNMYHNREHHKVFIVQNI